MGVSEAWVGECYLRGIKDGADYRCQVAVWAWDHDSFCAVLAAHTEPLGFAIIWLEEALPATQYLARYSDQNRQIGAFAQAVHPLHTVELAPMQPVATDGVAQSYITIEDHRLMPLPDQAGIPHWDRAWIVPDLKDLLFGVPKNGPEMRTYLILDASARKHITGFFDLDDLDVPVRCLFKGDAAETLKESAPYLIDMTLPAGACEDGASVPVFHRDFFAKHWGANTGIFIRTPAPMAEVWGHFRKFTKVAMEEDGNRVFFMFHDPRVLPGYLRNIQRNAAKVRCFCSDDQGAPFQFIVEKEGSGAFTACPDMALLAERPRPRFSLSYSDFLSHAAAVRRKRASRMAERIKADFPNELADNDLGRVADFALKITDRFNGYCITKQEYIHVLVAWSIFFGEGFEDKDPQGILRDICRSELSEDEKFARFTTRFEQFTYK